MTVRDFYASGDKGEFAQQLVRTYDEPTASNFRLLRAVADGRNGLLLDDLMRNVIGYGIILNKVYPSGKPRMRSALIQFFPMLAELDRELTPALRDKLPREAAEEDRQ